MKITNQAVRALGVVTLLLGVSLLTACKTAEIDEHSAAREPAKDRPAHHTDDGFRNLYAESVEKGPISFLKMKLFGDMPFSDQASEAHKVPVAEPDIAGLQQPEDAPQVTWLGHSSFLLQYQGINILTDPILSNRASPVSFAGPERLVAKPIMQHDLPAIDYVVISHNHYDHLDVESIEAIKDEAKFLVPLKLKDWFISLGVEADRVVEFDWWDQQTFGGLTVTATPSQHWSARGLFDRNKTLWAAWHIDIAGYTVWFAGDTGYNPHQFKEVSERFSEVDLGLIPIGAYAPRWFMGPQHINPEEAVLMHQDVKSKLSIGMHWGTFQLTAEPIMEPVERLQKALQEAKLEEDEFITLAIGETLRVKRG